jgi:protein dithiol:quinone oxidoreductase
MKQLSRVRIINLIAFLLCCGMIVTAAYLQFSKGLEPCPLCIIQRFIVIILGLIFLIGFLHKAAVKGWIRFYGFLVLLFAGAGLAAAARQVYLQTLPPDQLPPCAPNLSYILEKLSWIDAFKFLTRGSADCVQVKWTLLSLTIPEWTLGFFLLFTLLGLWWLLKAGRR